LKQFTEFMGVSPAWLPQGKRAAVLFHIDDIHPGRSSDPYEAGGDLERGALRHVLWLLDRHPSLRVTLFVTPDWREISPHPTRRMLALIPWIRDRVFLAPIRPTGTMRLDHHGEFVRFLQEMPRTELALHGLHHVHRGPAIPVEFQKQSEAECRRMLREALSVVKSARLTFARGMTPPGFAAPPELLRAMRAEGFTFVASSRDVQTDPAPDALSRMSGLNGVPLFMPSMLPEGLVHVPTNFQATSSFKRAHAVIEMRGLLSIKAHIIKNCMGHVALDGMDESYRDFLDRLFTDLERRWGTSLWWPSMEELSARCIALGAAA
jgi:hypothetical protein